MKTTPLVFLFCALFAGNSVAQDPHVIWYQQGGIPFGNATSAAGDLNHDGHSDFMIGSAIGIEVFSGADGTLLLTLPLTPGMGAPSQLCTLGDINGDGFPDYVVSSAGVDLPWGDNVGAVEAYSGADGSLLWVDLGMEANGFWGGALADVGDVNGDGLHDLLVGASSALSGVGKVRIYSGADGSLVREILGSDLNDSRLGHSAAGVGDVNLDGYGDYIIGAYEDSAAAVEAGMARVYSGFDGSTLYEFRGETTDDWFGINVDGGMDANGDGHPDFVITAHRGATGSNYPAVYVYSGDDGSLLWKFEGYGFLDAVNDPSFVGDINGDGFDDVAMGSTGQWSEVDIRSGLDGSLLYVVSDVQFTAMGSQAHPLGDVDADGRDDFILSGINADLYAFSKVYGGVATAHQLALLSESPFIAGTGAENFVLGTLSGTWIWLFRGTGHGRSYNVILGTIDVQDAIIAGAKLANADGNARFNIYIPPRFAGRSVWVQAVDGWFQKSNVVYRHIQ